VPALSDTIHLDMLTTGKRDGEVYGMHWGDPQGMPYLRFVRDQYVMPYLDPDHHALEIGAGGGRWTRYLLTFERLYIVDFHQELLEELAANFRVPSIVPIKNTGTDFPSVPAGSIDYLFSFGVFVHLDIDLIRAYLANMKPLLKPAANVVLQYSDKTKQEARDNKGFSENTPDIMRGMVLDAGYTVLEENLTILPHSSIVRFTPADIATFRASAPRPTGSDGIRPPVQNLPQGARRVMRRVARALRPRPART